MPLAVVSFPGLLCSMYACTCSCLCTCGCTSSYRSRVSSVPAHPKGPGQRLHSSASSALFRGLWMQHRSRNHRCCGIYRKRHSTPKSRHTHQTRSLRSFFLPLLHCWLCSWAVHSNLCCCRRDAGLKIAVLERDVAGRLVSRRLFRVSRLLKVSCEIEIQL